MPSGLYIMLNLKKMSYADKGDRCPNDKCQNVSLLKSLELLLSTSGEEKREREARKLEKKGGEKLGRGYPPVENLNSCNITILDICKTDLMRNGHLYWM